MAEKKLQPIIIKRVKKGGHAAHGGAWKIAYADFVTAMMAFFLLMWLLGSTAKGELQGIASYFASPMKVAMQGGDGSGNSSSILPGGGNDLTKSNGQVRRAETEAVTRRMNAEAMRAEQARQDQARIKALRAKIDSLISENPKLKEYKSQIRLDLTPDGLQIQIVDDQNRPMFDSGSALVKPYMRDILREIGASLGGVENRISLAGHTDATPYGNGERGYSNWELSADRANASRRELVMGGLDSGKVLRVLGMADTMRLKNRGGNDAVNRRISLLVLNHDTEAAIEKENAESDAVQISDPAAIEQIRAPLATPGSAVNTAAPSQPR